MAINPERKNYVTTIRSAQTRLRSRTNLNIFTQDSKAGSLTDIVADQHVENRAQMIAALESRSISTARGRDLDSIGRERNVNRLAATKCMATASERSFGFYVSAGTFASVNATSFVIPKGTKITSNPNQNEFNLSIEYVTTSAVTVQPTDSIIYVGIEAVASGSEQRVGFGTLVNHNVSNVSNPSLLLCTNFYPILNGRDEELDEAYRFRVISEYDRSINLNRNKVRMDAVRVPGVIDVKTVPGYYGIGSAAVTVLGSDYSTNTNLVSGVQSLLDSERGPASRINVISATRVFFDLELEISSSIALNAREVTQAKNSIRLAVFNYLRSIEIGGFVSLSDMFNEITRSLNGNIRARNTEGGTSVFKNVFIRKGNNVSAPDERERLIGDFYSLDSISYADLGTIDVTFS